MCAQKSDKVTTKDMLQLKVSHLYVEISFLDTENGSCKIVGKS